MEEKANKLGKSWKEPGKKIKLVSRLSQSDVKDVKQEGMVHVTINQRGLNRWSNNSEQKLGFLSKMKILKNAFNKK